MHKIFRDQEVKMFSSRPGIKSVSLSIAVFLLVAACSSERDMDSDHDTERYVKKAAIGDMFEIQSSELALTRASSMEVRDFARMMTVDHAKTSADLQTAIGKSGLNIAVPTELDSKHEELLEELQDEHGSDFDRLYAHIQKEAHMEAYKIHHNYSQSGDVPALKAAATAAVPVIEHHLMIVQRLPGN